MCVKIIILLMWNDNVLMCNISNNSNIILLIMKIINNV